MLFHRTSRRRLGRGTDSATRRRCQCGFALFSVVALMILGLLLVTSFSEASQFRLLIERDSASMMRAEMLAESALEYGLLQIKSDPDWAGTEGSWVNLGSNAKFKVNRLDSAETDTAHLVLTGVSGAARSVLEAEVGVGNGQQGVEIDFRNLAVGAFGGDVSIDSILVYGDMLVIDDPSGVQDFNIATGEWEFPSLDNPAISISGISISGLIYSILGAGPSYLDPQKAILEDPLLMPGWNLDPYLETKGDRRVIEGTVLQGMEAEETIVLLAPPNEDIQIIDCTLGGGLVIYCEPNFDYRGPPRNRVSVENTVFAKPGLVGLGERLGVHEGIGLIAPGAQLNSVRGLSSKGIFYMHSIKDLRKSWIKGSIFGINGVENVRGLSLERDPDNTFHYYYASIPGLILPDGEVDVQRLWPSYSTG